MASYPQPGRPLVPSHLRELLRLPLPANCLQAGFARLGDLDQTTWEKLSPQLCEALGDQIAGFVQQLILSGLPVTTLERPVGPLPGVVSIEDLNLDTRTSNCLKREGLHRSVQRLEEATIGHLASVRNFGARSLLNLLTASDDVRSKAPKRDEVERQGIGEGSGDTPQSPQELFMQRLREQEFFSGPKYPRRGHPLAPRHLKEVLGGPFEVPGWQGRLCELDQSAWSRLSEQQCHRLSDAIVADVTRSMAQLPPVIQSRRLGRFPVPLPLTTLGLDTRTQNALIREGFRNLKDMESVTIQELAAFPGFGAKSLLDLLSALQVIQEIPLFHSQRDGNLTRWARRVLSRRGTRRVSANDPRFGPLVSRVNSEAATLEEAVAPIMERDHDPWNPAEITDALRALDRALEAAQGLTIEEELEELVVARSLRDKQMTLMYMGWSPEGAMTLQAVGDEFGVTRERVRQIASRALQSLADRDVYAPVLDRSLGFLARQTPMPAADVPKVLSEKNWTKQIVTPEALLSVGRTLQRKPRFSVIKTKMGPQIVSISAMKATPVVAEAARKSVEHWGVTTVADLAAQVNDQGLLVDLGEVLDVLRSSVDFSWLDEATGWFWIPNVPRNRLLNQIRKILAVADSLSVSELRAGVGRSHRMQGFSPPKRVLLELCRQATGFRVEGERVLDDPPVDPGLLAEVERTFFDVLQEKGPLLTGKQLERECVGRGMNRSTFYVYLGYSPIIARYARGVYGLRGADVQPGEAEALVERKRSSRVLKDFGWRGGNIWISYRLSESMVSTGVGHIPTSISEHLQGKWELHADEVSLGHVTVRGTAMWGFGNFFRRRGGEPGDTLLLTLALSSRRVLVEVGDEDVLERYLGVGSSAEKVASAEF